MIPDTIEKRYYTIGQVATMLSQKVHNIRVWSDAFGMNAKANCKGARKRMFTPQQVEKLSTINAHLKEGRSALRLLKTIL